MLYEVVRAADCQTYAWEDQVKRSLSSKQTISWFDLPTGFLDGELVY